jgi:hypothetical protein
LSFPNEHCLTARPQLSRDADRAAGGHRHPHARAREHSNEPLCAPEPRPRRPARDTTLRHQSTPALGRSPDQMAYSDIRRGPLTPVDTRGSDLLIRGLALNPVGARWRGHGVVRVDGVRHSGRRVVRRTLCSADRPGSTLSGRAHPARVLDAFHGELNPHAVDLRFRGLSAKPHGIAAGQNMIMCDRGGSCALTTRLALKTVV